ncbi:MAG: nuclear transport factor 2 family protein [Neisseriaceae bacterium]|nr:nuclear transport factor 2 family protein [Neisseriaceae bacterium]
MHTQVTPEATAHHSVVALHDLIAAVFTGQDGPVAYAQLMHHFDADFHMVTISGAKVGLAAVQQLFKQGMGQRPGLSINISDVKTLCVAGQQVWVQYQETHTLADVVTRRLAVAYIQVVSASEWRWLYLHETPVLA